MEWNGIVGSYQPSYLGPLQPFFPDTGCTASLTFGSDGDDVKREASQDRPEKSTVFHAIPSTPGILCHDFVEEVFRIKCDCVVCGIVEI